MFITRLLKLLLCLMTLAVVSRSPAAPYLLAESEYEGDGYFRYRIEKRWEPTIASLNLFDFYVSFSNAVAVDATPAGWLLKTQTVSEVEWETTNKFAYWQGVPYSAEFRVQSSYTNYQAGYAVVLMSAYFIELLNDVPRTNGLNAPGYWFFPALVPCPPEDADGSPSILTTNLNFPDVAITGLIMSQTNVHGLTFSNALVATYSLQGSADLSAWYNIANIYGLAGNNTWTNATNLNHWGNYYRLTYLAYGHLPTNQLPPLDGPVFTSLSTGQPPAESSISTFSANQGSDRVVPVQTRFKGGFVEVTATTKPGSTYKATVYSSGKPVWSTQALASSSSLVIQIPVANCPRPSGFFHVEELTGPLASQ